MEEIDIEFGRPTVDMAMPLLTEWLRSMKKSGIKAVKIIHSYGSTGSGGRLLNATLKLLDELPYEWADKGIRHRRTVVEV
jgi:hypothetical protein